MDEFELSIIVPAYNEEKRITPFLKNLLDYSRDYLENYEILIVNDGSSDNTKEIVRALIKNHSRAKIIDYNENRGKGYAILKGIINSKGKFILFIDADGSTQPKEILRMYNFYLNYNFDVIIGSRISKDSNITNPQPMSRKLLSKIFNLYSNILFKLKIRDLLCGFKGFKREAAFKIFKDLKSYRWEFDVEILYNSRKNGLKIYQLPIEWKHEEGSKINFYDPFLIFLNLFILRLRFV